MQKKKETGIIMVAKIWIGLFVLYLAFTFYVYTSMHRKEAQPPPDGQVKAGWNLWQEKNCQACHQLYGLGGYMGPDLTNIAGNPDKGHEYMKAFIQHGTQRMPDFKLSEEQANNLIAFLDWVNKSGKSGVSSSKVNWFGSYNLDNE